MSCQNTISQKSSNYGAIDFAKLFFAYGIVGLHNGLLKEYVWGHYLHAIVFRLGVPFFFLCSGFFLSTKITVENKKTVLFAYCKKMLPAYLLLNMYYIPVLQIRGGYFSAGNMLNSLWYLITGRSTTVLWFVGALFWCALFLYFTFDGNKEHFKWVITIFFVIYSIGMFFNSHCYLLRETPLEFVYSWMANTFRSNSNALFCGFLFFSIGVYIEKFGLPKMLSTKSKQIGMLIGGLLGITGEYYLVRQHLDMVSNDEYYIFQVIVVPSLFLLLLNKSSRYFAHTKWIRSLSTYVYYFHMAILCFVIDCFEIHPFNFHPNSFFVWLVAAFITTIFSMVCIALKPLPLPLKRSDIIRNTKQKFKNFFLYNTSDICFKKVFFLFLATVLLYRWSFLLQLTIGKRLFLFALEFFAIISERYVFEAKSFWISLTISSISAISVLYYKIVVRSFLLDNTYLAEVLMESTLFFMIVFYGAVFYCLHTRKQKAKQ